MTVTFISLNWNLQRASHHLQKIQVLESASEITFLLLLILLAKVGSSMLIKKIKTFFLFEHHLVSLLSNLRPQGYTVTRARLRQWSAIKVKDFLNSHACPVLRDFFEIFFWEKGKKNSSWFCSFLYLGDSVRVCLFDHVCWSFPRRKAVLWPWKGNLWIRFSTKDKQKSAQPHKYLK